MKTLKPLTELQEKVLKFIIEFTEENFYQPSYREIACYVYEDTPIKPSRIEQHIKALERKGYVESQGSARALFIPIPVRKIYYSYKECPLKSAFCEK